MTTTVGILTLVKSHSGESVSAAAEKRALNDRLLAKALSDGGYRELLEPGLYKFSTDTFTVDSTSILAIGPGVSFEVNGTSRAPLSLNSILRYLGTGSSTVLGYQNVDVTKTDADAVESSPAPFTLFIPGNTIQKNDTLRFDYLIDCDNASGAAKRLRGRFGGVVLWNFDLTTHIAYHGRYELRCTNTQAAQIGLPNSSTSWGTFSSVDCQDFTVDFANDQTFTFTMQWPVAGAGSNRITLRSILVEHIRMGV